MSSNELYGGLNYVDFTLAAGAFATADVRADCVGNFLSCSRIVGVSLQEATAVNNANASKAQNIAVTMVLEPQAGGANPLVNLTASNVKTNTDTATYRVYWVNEAKVGYGVPVTLPSPLPSPLPLSLQNITNQIYPC